MLNGIREKGLGVLNWTPEAEQLRLRLQCAAQWLPEEAWPAVDDASLLASLEAWLLPQMNGVHSLRALKALDLRQALQDLSLIHISTSSPASPSSRRCSDGVRCRHQINRLAIVFLQRQLSLNACLLYTSGSAGAWFCLESLLPSALRASGRWR